MTDELSLFQQRLVSWQRENGMWRVVALSTLFSVVVSSVLGYGVIFVFMGFSDSLREGHPIVMALPVLVPLVVSPIVTLQLTRALSTAARVIDDLSEARVDLQREIAARIASQRELEHLARRDSLTGLLNRRGFFDEVDTVRSTEGVVWSIATADVDRFKTVNDRYGHAAGDSLLRSLAERLSAAAGSGAIVARMGGDEFVAAFPDPSRAAAIGDSLAHFDVTDGNGRLVVASASMGVVDGVDLGDVDTALASADASLYRAKDRRRVERGGFATFEP